MNGANHRENNGGMNPLPRLRFILGLFKFGYPTLIARKTFKRTFDLPDIPADLCQRGKHLGIKLPSLVMLDDFHKLLILSRWGEGFLPKKTGL